METEGGEFNSINLLSVDSSFFTVFSFPVYKGAASGTLTSETIVVSKEKATVLFGTDDIIGRLITLKMADTTRLLMVSAVVDKPAENSHLVFDALVAHSVLENKWNGGASYVLLNTASQAPLVQNKINHDSQRPGLIGPGKVNYFFEPLASSYFNKANKTTYMKTRDAMFIRISTVVCALLLFMAGFNFVSLFLLSLQSRKKASGIKKTLGISWWSMAIASSVEVMLYIVVAFALSVLLIFFLLPYFNSILETSLAFKYMSRLKVLIFVGTLVFILGVMVVIFAVAQQHSVQPVSLMKNAALSTITFNRWLFTIQFIISITMAICAITFIRQMNFLENEPLGFNRNIIRLQAPDKKLNTKLSTLKQMLLQISGIRHASITSGNPISGNWMARYDLDDGKFYTPYLFSGDEDFLKTLNLTLLQGDRLSASSPGKLVNEKLVRYFNIAHPLGEKIPGTDDRIIGVVKDFTCTSFKDQVPPAIISYSIDNSRLLIDYSGQNISVLLPQIQHVWSKVFPGHPFTYQVIQEELMKKYREETFLYKTVVTFSITSMVISCFGLFALSWAVVQSRMKEIGIRKMLGAMPQDIMRLLSMSFLKRIFIAFLIAAPAGYFLMEKWLENFVTRISLNGWIFGIAALVVTLIALATLSLQTIKAAVSNPIDELRNN